MKMNARLLNHTSPIVRELSNSMICSAWKKVFTWGYRAPHSQALVPIVRMQEFREQALVWPQSMSILVRPQNLSNQNVRMQGFRDQIQPEADCAEYAFAKKKEKSTPAKGRVHSVHGMPFTYTHDGAQAHSLKALVLCSHLLLVWHVLPTLHGPHKVKGGIWEGLCQRIPNLQKKKQANDTRCIALAYTCSLMLRVCGIHEGLCERIPGMQKDRQ
eukprot:1002672-Pelagomonas_calceolata.AAC.3